MTHAVFGNCPQYVILFLLLILPTTASLLAQSNMWGPVDLSKSFTPTDQVPDLPDLDQGRSYALDLDAMRSLAATAPSEGSTKNKVTEVDLPLPDGSFQRFRLIESSMMESGLQANFPEIRSYLLKGIDDPLAGGRMTVSPHGLSVFLYSGTRQKDVVITKLYKDSNEEHISYYEKDANYGDTDWVCSQINAAETALDQAQQNAAAPKAFENGDILHLIRLAVSVPGDLSEQWGWTTVSEAMAAITGFMGQVTAIYERDVAVRFVFPVNQEALIHLDSATDPYISNGGGTATDESAIQQELHIGVENYDLGLIFVTGGCCAAGGSVVCGSRKSRNFSRFNNVRITAHEIGHNFSAPHTWTSCGPDNNGQYGTNEYGSGTSIMSYTGICSVDNILPPGFTTFFGVDSRRRMVQYTNTLTCPQEFPTGNTAPSLSVPASGFHIPISTPFVLTATSTDAENDPLTYAWEQTNMAGVDFFPDQVALSIQNVPVPADGDIPIQRIFGPVASPSRTIPQLSDLLANNSTIFERLPTYTRNIKYSVFVRDNHPGGGGSASEEVSFEVDGTAGPFLVTAPNTCVTWMAGTSQTVTWDVANTTNANVNTQTVNILLSEDGGYTYPHTLATATTNDGSESITVPAGLCTNMARVKVEAVGNIFFDISNEDFNIEDGSTPVVSADALLLDGVDDYVVINNTTLGNFGTSDFTVELWIKTTETDGRPIIGKREICGATNLWGLWMDSGKLRMELLQDGTFNPYVNVTGNAIINDDAWHHIALVRTGDFYITYVDGNVDFSLGAVGFDFDNSAAILIGSSPCTSFVDAQIDEVRIWDVARTPMELTDNNLCYQVGNESNLLAYYPVNSQNCGTCNGALTLLDNTANGNDGTFQNGATAILSTLDIEECPTCTNGNITITTNPASQTLNSDVTVTFTAVATGSNISYQWEISTDNGATYTQIANADESTYSFTTENANDGNQYRCLMTNGCDVQTTSAATLTINCPALSLTDISGDASPCVDNYASYLVDPNPNIATWDWTVPAGWMISNFDNMIVVLVANTSGNISLTATDYCGAMDTKTFAVVPVLIEITTQPNSQTVSEGANVDFTTAVSAGGGTTTYQWQQSTDDGSIFNDINGAIAATYNVASATVQHDDRNYRCIVINDCLQDTTTTAILTVNCGTSSPSIPGGIAGPAVICGTSTVSYSIMEVAGASSYSWTLPVGWTGSSTTNTITATTNGSGGVISVSSANSCASSDPVNLSVAVNPGTCLNALHFDGVNDYLEMDQNGQFVSGDLTISCWVNPAVGTGIQELVSSGHEYRLFLEDGQVAYNHSIIGGSYNDVVDFVFSNGTLPLNSWSFVSVTRETATSTIKFYLNGVLMETQTWGSSFPSTPTDEVDYPLTLGAASGGTSKWLEGSLDEIKIWSELRTDSQVAEDMFCVPTGTEPNLLAYLGFEQGVPYGVNTGITSFSNSASAYPDATPQNLALTGTVSNLSDGTKTQVIDGLDRICPGAGTATYTIDLPGTPTVVWTLPVGWVGSSTTESITVTPGANGGLLVAEATLSCGTARLEKAVTTMADQPLPQNTRALDFDGADDYLELPSGSVTLSNKSFTVEFWAKRSASDELDIFANQGSNSTNQRLHIGFRSGSNQFTFAFFGNDLNTTATYTDTDWHHWACVYDQSIASPNDNRFIYRDGQLVASDRTDSDFEGSGAFQIGRYSDDYAYGTIDEYRVWGEARSVAELNENSYCSFDCPPAELLLYLPMEDGIIGGNNTGLTTVTDYGNYGHTANLNGFALTGNSSNIVDKFPTSITGPTVVCTDFGWTYNVPAITGATGYTWTLPSGWTGSSTTNSITATPSATSGTIQCAVAAPCGTTTFTLAVTVNSSCHTSLDFDGVDDRLEVSGVDVSGSSFTVEFWAKRDGLAANQFIFDQGASNTANNRVLIGFNGDNVLRFAFYANDLDVPVAYNSTDWHHWACVYDKSIASPANNRFIYRDGQLVASDRSDSDFLSNGTIKIANAFGANHYNGALDEFRIWNVARTGTEINDNMFCPLTTVPASVQLYLPFEDGIASGDNTAISSTHDFSANSLSAALINLDQTGANSNYLSGVSYTRYRDVDGDNYGDAATTTTSFCTAEAYALRAADCDDNDMTINPYAPEICGNGIDEDCDGNTDLEVNKALNFTGPGTVVQVPVLTLGADYTVEAWFRVDNDNSFGRIIEWGGSPRASLIMSNDNRLGYFVNGGGSWGGVTVDDGEWHHVALVHEGYAADNLRFYVDGVLSRTASSPDVITPTTITIGSRSNGSNVLDGDLDDVRFWDTALTAQQIASRWDLRLEGNEINLIRYYTFDHGRPGMDNSDLDQALDRTANAAHANLLNFDLTGTTNNWIAGRAYPNLYVDTDADGYGGTTAWTCGPMTGYVRNNQDCADDDAMVNPYAVEICGNSIDDDCDGDTDLEVNRGLSFDGSNDRIIVPNIAHSEFFSVETWIKIDNTDNDFRNILRWSGGGGDASWTVYTDGRIGYFEGPGNINGPDLRDGQWHHVVLVHDGYGPSNIRCYVDGNHVLTSTRNLVQTNTTLTIGGNSSGSSNVDATLDDFRYWNTVITPQQISDRMNLRLDGDESNLVLYYPFDHGTAGDDNTGLSIAKDATAGGNDGTLTGFALTGNNSNWVAARAYPTLYPDEDSDGFGATTAWTCGSMTSAVANNVDCDDTDPNFGPSALDICGNGIDENCNGIIDDNTMALHFNGDGNTDDEVNFGNTIPSLGTNDFTIELNFRTTGPGGLVSKSMTPSADPFFQLSIDAGNKLSFLSWENGLQNTASVNNFATPPAINVIDGNWHHAALVHDSGTYTIYVDGTSYAVAVPGIITDQTGNTFDWKLGVDGFGNVLDGDIDDLRIWNVARSQTDIDTYQNAHLTGSETGLVVYYDFNNPNVAHDTDNSGQTTVTDRTANGYNGTLNNFALTGTTSNWVGNPIVTNMWYADTDMDGYGDPDVSTVSCAQPTNFVSNNEDCDDTNMLVNPSQPEVLGNMIDDNCNGAIDEESLLRWVLLDSGSSEGSCTSGTDCCTQTFCYGLEYTPANTGTLSAYTTGFFTDCVSGASPVISNASCVMNDMSEETDGCATESMTLINSSGNNGSLAVTADVAVIIHQVCYTIPNNSSITVTEDMPTDLTMSVDFANGDSTTEFPSYVEQVLNGNVAPTIPADGSMTVECITAAVAPTTPTVTDVCGNDVTPMLISTVDSPDPITCEGTRTYTYTYTDCSGLASTWNFVYTIDITTAPIVPIDGSLTVECITAAVAPTTPMVTDACGEDITPTLTSTVDSPDPVTCEGTRTYTYTYTDCSGLASTWDFVYTIDITTAPVVPAAGSLTVECITAAVAPATPTVNDACGSEITPVLTSTVDSPDPITCEGTRTYTYTYTDCSGLASTWDFVYTIDITTAPVVPVNGSMTVECIIAAVAPATPTVNDACGSEITPVLTSTIDSPDPITCEGTRTYTYTYTDCSGLASTWDFVYTIDITTAPVVPIAGSLTVECISAAVAPTTPTVNDACGSEITPVLTSTVDSPDPITCEGTRTYTYTYTDCSGLASTWDFVYTIDITTAPIVPVDGSMTVECITAAVAPATPTVNDACGSEITPVLTSTIDSPDPITCEGTRTYTYTYTDCSGLASTWDFVYTIDITTAPVVPVDGSLTVECISAAVAPATPTVNDACGSEITPVLTSTVDSPDPITCEGTRTYTYTYTDCSGLASTWDFVYTIDITTAPVVPVDGSLTVECIAAAVAPTPPTVADACGADITPMLTSTVDSPDPISCEGTRTYTYTYTDCSGLASTWDFVYTIDITTAPIVPVDGSLTVECIAAAVAPSTPTVNDACGNEITPVLTSTVDAPDPLTCEGTRTYTYTYEDCSGLASTWSYVYTIDITTLPIEIGGPVSDNTILQNVLDTIAPTTLPVIQDACGNVLTPMGPVVVSTYEQDDCEGTVTYTYTYTDCASNSFDWIYTYNIDCGTMNLRVFLEGPMSGTSEMATTLNDNHVLPGQDKLLSPNLSIRISAPFTPFGHPYGSQPWNYTNTTGNNYGDATTPGAPAGVLPYSPHVVDWVLITIREDGLLPEDDLISCAGWLYKDGSVSFPEDCLSGLVIDPIKTYYVLVQQRNHLGILGEATIQGGNDHLQIDFTVANSYRPNVFRAGQKEVSPGVWAMYSSNGDQLTSIRSINSVDRTLWRLLQNDLGYINGDYNMNAVTNSADETAWKNNQNKTTGVTFE